ncbi:MAG: 2-C-methyl-D-erythritol 4-phosphate cytidylyltransferase [Actinomycetota bacterium]|nr:2-C-methyl-D-erythritol 4-phosphate cytidylyltransferase [Actinomycetota bacterium]
MTKMRLRTVGVVLAGGRGARMGADRPKQLLRLGDRTVLEHAVAALHRCDEVDEVVVVMAEASLAEAARLLGAGPFPKVSRLVAGGGDRVASTRRALAALGPEECDVLVHDAARPLLPEHVVRSCLAALRTYEAVGVAVPVTDTVVRTGPDGLALDVVDRAALRSMQTPQGFRLSVLRRAHELAAADPSARPTDDCSVVLARLPDVAVTLVPGDVRNLKVTSPVDLLVAEQLLRQQPDRPGQAAG